MKKLLLTVAAALVLAPPAAAGGADVRFATFNASLNRNVAGQLVADLSTPNNAQAAAVAEIVQRVRPDVLLINEFDFAPAAVGLFQQNYLSVPHNGAAAIEYPYTYIAPSNTGIPSGKDLNNAGGVVTTPGAPGYGDDSFGFGAFPGQFGMVVYSRYPIDPLGVRTFQLFKWKDMPGNLIPQPFYSPDEVEILRLSSKSHWDLPIRIEGKTVHFLVSHPTPPVFDGPEDRNGTRNFDEIRFWADYITPGAASGYIYDDAGNAGGLKPGELFVIAGDQNSDPLDGDSIPGAIQQLIEHPLVNTKVTPESAGAVEAAALQGGANLAHRSDPRFDTADFADGAPGNLRADYVLPRKTLQIAGAGVFWPLLADPLSRLTGVFPFPSSDHRSVWVDVSVPAVQ
jgi:3-phytase